MKADVILFLISLSASIGTAVLGFTASGWWFLGTLASLGILWFAIETIKRREFVSGRNFEKTARDKGHGTWLPEDEE